MFVDLDFLSEGCFGQVWKAKIIENEKEISIVAKVLIKEKNFSECQELKINKLLQTNNHKNICNFIKDTILFDYPCLIFEMVPGQNLLDFLKKGYRLSIVESFDIFSQILDGIEFLHSIGIIHNDIKLENIILDTTKSSYKPKIIDFGLSRIFDKESEIKDASDDSVGSFEYLAPEKCDPLFFKNNNNIDHYIKKYHFSGIKADIWSLGTVIFSIVFREFPWSKNDRKSAFNSCLQNRPLIFPKDKTVSDDIKNFISNFFEIDFNKRPNICTIKENISKLKL